MNKLIEEFVRAKAPMLVRYSLMAVAGYFANKGWTDADQNTLLTGNMDILVGAVLVVGTVAWGWVNKPTLKAQKIAAVVDAEVKTSDPIVLKTPVGSDDITVTAKGDVVKVGS